jgi:AcrR family transcriptional regulator
MGEPAAVHVGAGVGRRHAPGSRRVASRAAVTEIQRSRILTAAAQAVEELGYANATVAHISSRARVSRRTFYDVFTDREACLLATLEHAVDCIAAELATAGLEGLVWCERVRMGLWTFLCFFDQNPALARLCVVQSARGSQSVLERREEILTSLAAIVDEGRAEGQRGVECPPLVAEGLVGAALAIVYSRLLKGEGEQLAELLGDLMGMIVLPYLGPAAARRERTRLAPTHPPDLQADEAGDAEQRDILRALPMRLTYRTALVLEEIARHPGVSNRTVADRVGIADQGQVSKLLGRLERLVLLVNTGAGHTMGEPNAWQLTQQGEEVRRAIAVHAPRGNRQTNKIGESS